MKNLKIIDNKEIADLSTIKEKVAEYAKNAFAKNTIINYESDWKTFCSWCNTLDINPEHITHKILTAYITNLAEQNYKASTIQRKISGIAKYCETNNIYLNIKNKDFKLVWQGIRRKLGIAKQGKDPILLADLEEILEHIPINSSMGIRDRALLSFGWFSAMRRSEIVALNWDDISFIKEGILITIKQSKTDQFGEGQKIAILKRNHLCPIKYLRDWQNYNTKKYQPVFCSLTKSGSLTGIPLSSIDVGRIVKKWAPNIGFDRQKIAGHSLRRGFVTTAVSQGIRNHIIMKTTRHKSSKMIDDYTSDKSLLENNASNMLHTNSFREAASNNSSLSQVISQTSKHCSKYAQYLRSQTASLRGVFSKLWGK